MTRLLQGTTAWIPELAKGTRAFCAGLLRPVTRAPGEAWWQRPGWGIMYQIEYRPGWEWDRDYEAFNASMRDEEGRFRFDGPRCRVEEWVGLSREAGVDYHIMEAKWHDGICFFDTALTDWKADEDYAAGFARLSREAGIPFLFYYSAIFDHNPRFDAIQPDRRHTFSLLALGGRPEYEEYLRGHYRELVERYRPDGMWVDWYWPGDGSTEATFAYFRENHPEVVLGLNFSNYLAGSYRRSHYTIGEAHHLAGPLVTLRRTGSSFLPVIHSAWGWTSIFRRMLGHPWELIAPAGLWWQDPRPREDPRELARMAAVVMAGGGRFSVGATSRMDGSVEPGQAELLRALGEWYRPRRHLFSRAVPLSYRGSRPPGVRVSPRGVKAIAARHGGDILLHLVNTGGSPGVLEVWLEKERWGGLAGVRLEPAGSGLEAEKTAGGICIRVAPSDIDAVDTILRLMGSGLVF